MSKVGSWSTTPGSNNATPPDGWPEGQAPSTVNDCAREMMASIRTLIATPDYIDLGNTPSFLTTTTFSMATADVANFEVGRRLKLFDSTTLYGTIISVSATQVQVRLDSGVLSTSLSSVAMGILRPSTNPLPEIAFRSENMIINGNMDIFQRGVTFTTVTNGQYLADRWNFGNVTGAVFNASAANFSVNASNVPTLAQSGVFFQQSLKLSVSTTGVMSISAFTMLSYHMEGYEWAQIAHKPLGLGFWVNTNKSGVYAVALRGANDTQSLVVPFTISAVSTWQRFYMALPAAPTAGSWNYQISLGLRLSFVLAAGTQFQVTNANSWTSINALAIGTQVNFNASVGNTFAVTGVTLHEGIADIPCEVKRFGEEIAKMQRYYYIGPNLTVNFSEATATAKTIAYPNHMRTNPIITAITAAGAGSPISFVDITTAGFRYYAPSGANVTDYTWVADAEL